MLLSARLCRNFLRVFRAAGFDLVLVETPGTGQTGLDLGALRADLLVYVKTREYGSALQLQKDQLLRDAELVVLNKADLEGAEAAFGEMQGVLAELGKRNAAVPDYRQGRPRPGTRPAVRRDLPAAWLAGSGPRKARRHLSLRQKERAGAAPAPCLPGGDRRQGPIL